MGYSLNVRFPNVELRDKVLRFFDEHYRTWEQVADLDGIAYLRGPTDDPSYAPHDAPVIGFDYSAGEADVQYAWRICAWMAAVPLTRWNCNECQFRVHCLTTEDCALRVVNYDGHEDIPFSDFKGIDEEGFFPRPEKKMAVRMLEALSGEMSTSRFNEIVKAELHRLTELWRTYGNP